MTETDEQFVERMAQTHTIASRDEFDRLVALTRRGAAVDDTHAVGFREGAAHMHKAQSAEIERLRAALREIAKHSRGGVIDTTEKMDRDEFIGIARAALEERT